MVIKFIFQLLCGLKIFQNRRWKRKGLSEYSNSRYILIHHSKKRGVLSSLGLFLMGCKASQGPNHPSGSCPQETALHISLYRSNIIYLTSFHIDIQLSPKTMKPPIMARSGPAGGGVGVGVGHRLAFS